MQHATSPHHGSGAGFAIEDSAVLAELLADERVKGPDDLEPVFEAFETNRKERSQWLVQSSRRVGDLYEWRAEGVGEDFKKIEEALKEGFGKIWNVDIADFVREAKEDLGNRLRTDGKS